MERLNLDKFKILAAAATLAMFAGTACAEVELFGQLNRAITHTDDKRNANTLFVDNAFSPSGLGVKAMSHLNKCVTVGGVGEVRIAPNNSREVNQLNTNEINTNIVSVKRADVWMSGGMFGKLSVGYGDAASHGIARMSYSKMGDTVSSSRVADLAGGMLFHTTGSASAPFATAPSVNMVFDNIDGVGSFDSLTGLYRQKNRVRWDSEKWMGLSLAVSHGSVQEKDGLNTASGVTLFNNSTFNSVSKSFTDAAVRYEGHFSDFMLSAGIAWAKYSRDGITLTDDTGAVTPVVAPAGTTFRGQRLWAGSVAAEHKPTGINAAFSYGDKRKTLSNYKNQKVWFAQVGKHFDWMHHGKTHVAVDYYKGKQALVNSDTSKSWGVGAVQDLDKVNSSVYATVRTYKYTAGSAVASPAIKFDKITAAGVGVLFKFGAML